MLNTDLRSDVDLISSEAAEQSLAASLIELDADPLEWIRISAEVHDLSYQDDRKDAEYIVPTDSVAEEEKWENQHLVWQLAPDQAVREIRVSNLELLTSFGCSSKPL